MGIVGARGQQQQQRLSGRSSHQCRQRCRAFVQQPEQRGGFRPPQPPSPASNEQQQQPEPPEPPQGPQQPPPPPEPEPDGGHERRRPEGPVGRLLSDPLNAEILSIALPMLATLAADPVAGLVDTAYVGRLGAAQLAGVGVALSVFNTTTKLLNVPLLSVTTSSVAAAAGREAAAARAAAAAAAVAKPPGGAPAGGDGREAAAQAPSGVGSGGLSSALSSSLLIAGAVGCLQAALLLGSGGWAARLWGLSPSSALWGPASEFLSVRALGAPVTVLLLVMQGVYRGLSDTRTPFYATLAANGLNVALGWALIFGLGLGVRGAALATVTAQFVPLCWLFWRLASKYGVTFSDRSTLAGVAKLFAPTGFLVLRTAAITFTYAFATGLTARAGPAAAACHQVCFQLWLASSLMADSLAVACQTMIAKSLAARDAATARKVVDRCVGAAALLGCALALLLGLGRDAVPSLFTSDAAVLALAASVLPFVVATQPVNALAFVWDGVLFGAGGFRFASLQMAMCALPAVAVMHIGPHALEGAPEAAKLQYVWLGLALVMGLRAASIWAPYKLRLPPFRALAPGAGGGGAGADKQ